MIPGDIACLLTRVKSTNIGSGVVATYDLEKNAAFVVLCLGSTPDRSKPFNVEEAMRKLGWVRAT